MKKLLIFALLGLFSLSSYSQTALRVTLTDGVLSGAVLDTTTDAGTSTLYMAPVKGIIPEVVGVQVILTKISGTVGGSTVLQGSLDGETYTTIGSAYTPTNVASQSTFFTVAKTANPYIYFRILDTGTGTQARSIKAYSIVRR